MRLRDRLRNAWQAFNNRMTQEQSIRLAHELGMHKNYVDGDCEVCFIEHLEAYINMCATILIGIDRADQIPDFEAFLREIAGETPNLMLLHEHPAYLLADFLGIGYDTPAFDAVLEQTAAVNSRMW
jgi:hypothetical protein